MAWAMARIVLMNSSAFSSAARLSWRMWSSISAAMVLKV